MGLGTRDHGVTTMTGAAVTLFTAVTQDLSDLFFSLLPATQNLTALSIEATVKHGSNTWMTLASAAGDFTAPSGSIFGASGDLTTLAAASEGWCKVEVHGDFKIRVRATATAGGTVDWDFNTGNPGR